MFKLGQEVELWEGSQSGKWKHYFYIGETSKQYFLAKSDLDNGFDNAFYTDNYPKNNYSIKPLKSVCETTLAQVCKELRKDIKIIP